MTTSLALKLKKFQLNTFFHSDYRRKFLEKLKRLNPLFYIMIDRDEDEHMRIELSKVSSINTEELRFLYRAVVIFFEKVPVFVPDGALTDYITKTKCFDEDTIETLARKVALESIDLQEKEIIQTISGPQIVYSPKRSNSVRIPVTVEELVAFEKHYQTKNLS